MNSDLHGRVVIAIHTYFPLLVNDYLENHEVAIENAKVNKQPPEEVLNLVITLKHWANPLANYTNQLAQNDKNDFKAIPAILNSPRYLLSQEKNITAEDEKEIKVLVCYELNEIADALLNQYQLGLLFEARFSTKTALKDWWEGKTMDEKKEIEKRFNALPKDEKKNMLNVTHSAGFKEQPCYLYYHMCRSTARSNALGLFFLASLFSERHPASMGAPGAYLHQRQIHHHHHRDRGGFFLSMVGIIIIGAGVVGAWYALTKGFKSITNLLKGKKVLRSVSRLLGMLGGALLGGWTGALLGMAIGSAIPLIGTMVGGIIGLVFGSAALAGASAKAVKIMAKWFSAQRHYLAINPTNPEKYQLSQPQLVHLQQINQDISTTEAILKAIHTEKLLTTDQRRKKALNQILVKVKEGQINQFLMIGNLTFDLNLNRFDVEKKTDSTQLRMMMDLNKVPGKGIPSREDMTSDHFPQTSNFFSPIRDESTALNNSLGQAAHSLLKKN